MLNEKGGKADNMTIEEIARKHGVSVGDIKAQVKKGIKVESEHTEDKELAKEIALDHLVEDARYYDKLEKMEKMEQTEKKNAKELPKVFYCKHMQAGVAKYENEMILIENEALKKMMPTFAGKPVYVEHTEVNIDKIQEEADGYVSECFYNENDGWYWNKFIAISDNAQQKIREGWSVSNAYMPTQSGEGGVWHNVDYDRQILDGEYSHLAIVPNPRYEQACIMTPERYKAYNDELKNQLIELKNSKKESKFSIIGGLKMKLWKKKKEDEIKNAEDIVVELEDGKTMVLSEMVNAVKKNEEEEKEKEEKENECEKYNEDDKVEVGDEMMTVKELKNKYMNMVKKQAKKNAEEEEEKEKENKKNAEEEKEKKEEEEAKENSKHYKEMKNSISKAKDNVENSPTYDSREDRLKRGRENF